MIAWIAFALSVIGIALNAKKDIRCWPVWIASNVLWVYHTVTVGEHAALVTWAVFLVFNFYGWNEWWRAAHGGLKPFKRNILYTLTVEADNHTKWTITTTAEPDGFVVRKFMKSKWMPAKEVDKFVSLNYNRAVRIEREWSDAITKLAGENK